MKLGLFAAGEVGLEIARVLAARGDRPACLVLDPADRGSQNEAIVAASGVGAADVVDGRELLAPATRERLRALALDLILLAWWPRLVPPSIIGLPRRGCLNLHPSLLPHNRGKDPNFWALAEGTPYGVTIHHVDAGVDSGPIAFQAPLAVGWEDTGATLYERAKERLVRLFAESYERICRGDLPRRPQSEPPTPARRRADLDAASRIDLDRPCRPRDLLNRLRARTFPPHPACWFDDGGDRYEVRVSIRKISPEPASDG